MAEYVRLDKEDLEVLRNATATWSAAKTAAHMEPNAAIRAELNYWEMWDRFVKKYNLPSDGVDYGASVLTGVICRYERADIVPVEKTES